MMLEPVSRPAGPAIRGSRAAKPDRAAHSRGCRRPALTALLLLVLVAASPATASAAQDPGDTDRADAASPFLPPGHWAHTAVERLHALGLLEPGYDPGAGPLTRRTVARLLSEAVDRADSIAPPPIAGLAVDLQRRYRTEFPEYSDDSRPRTSGGLARRTGWVNGGYRLAEDRIAPGTGYTNGENWTGPREVASISDVVLGSNLSIGAMPYFAAAIDPYVRSDGHFALRRGHAIAAWGPGAFWAGRREIGLGPAAGGGIVATPRAAVDGAGLLLTRGVRLPSVLGYLGPVRLETLLSRQGEVHGEVDRSWLWLSRAYAEPHPRLGIGLNRGVMVGTFDGGSIGLRELAFLAAGKHLSAPGTMDNSIVSVDFTYRPPLSGLPALLYLEWGFEDSAGAWRDVPGIIAGVRLPAVPGLPELQVGLERASFARSCCGNPRWYRHWGFTGGWTIGDSLLGHPLGGHGREWRAYADTHLDDARVHVGGAFLLRDRRGENVFAPLRQGGSVGGAMRIRAEMTDAIDFLFEGVRESGDGWDDRQAFVGARYRF